MLALETLAGDPYCAEAREAMERRRVDLPKKSIVAFKDEYLDGQRIRVWERRRLFRDRKLEVGVQRCGTRRTRLYILSSSGEMK